jgi:excisionase family DNA binding protein
MESLLSPKEVANALSLSVETIYRWIENGTLPAIKVGKRAVRVSEKSLKAWLDNQPHLPTREKE